MSDEERQRIWTLADEGRLYRDIVEATGRPYGTVAKTISDGILLGKVTRRNGRTDERERLDYE
jgi:hypothetical protein